MPLTRPTFRPRTKIHPTVTSIMSAIKHFFSANRQYAVAGASNNPSKFGYKILNWYIEHGLKAIPINPREEKILNQPVVANVTAVLEGLKAKKDIAGYSLSDKDGLSISFLTPPAITIKTLQEIGAVDGYKDLIKGLWLQPGSFDNDVVDMVQALGLEDVLIFQGLCILVQGESGMYSANL